MLDRSRGAGTAKAAGCDCLSRSPFRAICRSDGPFWFPPDRNPFSQQTEVPILNMTAIFAKMSCNAVGTRIDSLDRGGDGIGFTDGPSAITRLTERGGVIDIDPQFQHRLEMLLLRRSGRKRRRSGMDLAI